MRISCNEHIPYWTKILAGKICNTNSKFRHHGPLKIFVEYNIPYQTKFPAKIAALLFTKFLADKVRISQRGPQGDIFLDYLKSLTLAENYIEMK